MATFCRHMGRMSRLHSLLRHGNVATNPIICSRPLFSGEILGLDAFRRQKSIIEDKLGDLKDNFRERMEEYMNSETHNTIFTDDLKTIAHVATNDMDVTTAVNMAKRYHQQNCEVRFGVFQFGPVLLRMLYSLGKPEVALELFKDPALDGFFDQMSSFLILMDLLYEHTMYQEALVVYDLVKDRQLAGFKYPVDCTTLAIASCYKLNSPESLESAMAIIKGTHHVGSNLSQRSICYSALLALKQDKPGVALELVSMRQERRVGPTTNIRALAFVELGRIQDALHALKATLQQDLPSHFTTGNEIFQSTMDKVKKAVDSKTDSALKRQFETLERSLLVGNHISPRDLDEFICMTILRPRRPEQNSYKSRQRAPPVATFRRAKTFRTGITDGE